MTWKSRQQKRQRRHVTVRKKLMGTAEKPRVSVFRSLSQIYVQLIDDVNGKTLVAASTIEKDLRAKIGSGKKTDQAREIGKVLAQRAKSKGIQRAVFDRGGYRYHGRVKALAEGAREAGLQF
jgi:large subunit ribosomal protein L18